MLRFKQFMVEYLTDEQRKNLEWDDYEMSDEARANTDHHFGEGNDIVKGKIDDDAGHVNTKSEIHRAVEAHLKRPISHEEYKSGITADAHGRPAKLGRMIKDENLRNQFASDNSREGSKKTGGFTTSTVRGIEVAGQTNSAPNKEHPKGHSWGNLSCKNVDNGVNKHYLKAEVHNGTVVHRVHDHNGQEIYRATLQPHHNEDGDVAYSVNSEYGIMHPAFRKSAQETAKKLSGSSRSGIFKIHPAVYNDSDRGHILHPNLNSMDIDNILDSGSSKEREAAIRHSNANTHHINKALHDHIEEVRLAAAKHPNATPQNIDTALNDHKLYIRKAGINNPNASSENLHKALQDKEASVRAAAAAHPNASTEHLEKAFADENDSVRAAAAGNKNATKEHLDKVIDDKDDMIRLGVAQNRNATPDHIDKLIDKTQKYMVRDAAIKNKNATPKNIDKALDDEDSSIRKVAVSHRRASEDNINKALKDKRPDVRDAAIKHEKATPKNIDNALGSEHSETTRYLAASHPNASEENLRKALQDDNPSVQNAAKRNLASRK